MSAIRLSAKSRLGMVIQGIIMYCHIPFIALETRFTHAVTRQLQTDVKRER